MASSHQLTSSRASIFAPAFSNVLTTSLCPLSTASCSGVACCYSIKYCVLVQPMHTLYDYSTNYILLWC